LKTIFLTGTNKGLGLEFVRQYLEQGNRVIATCRNRQKAPELMSLVNQYKGLLDVYYMDLADFESINNLGNLLRNREIDIFINNAATNAGYITNKDQNVFGKLNPNLWIDVFSANCVAPLLLAEVLHPNILIGREKKMIFLTAKTASISDNSSGGFYMNRSARTALNQSVKSLSIDLKGDKISVAVVSPGWVATDSGGVGMVSESKRPKAMIDPSESVSGMIKAIEQLSLEKSGLFVDYKGKLIPW
jgi:NAD(P)-dependent dehydrogenase (short-subunit alcohol dehydrogenase family)